MLKTTFFCRFKQSFRIIQRGVGHGPPTSEKRRKWRKQEAVFDGFRAKKLFLGGLEKRINVFANHWNTVRYTRGREKQKAHPERMRGFFMVEQRCLFWNFASVSF